MTYLYSVKPDKHRLKHTLLTIPIYLKENDYEKSSKNYGTNTFSDLY